MSRAFVKDDSQDAPVLIPPRAPLPAGVINYVTPRGRRLLSVELERLDTERHRLHGLRSDDTDKVRGLTIVNGKIDALKARISTAKVLRGDTQSPDQVRFGARVTVRTVKGPREGLTRSFMIVGVDEADVSDARVAFVAPIARAVVGCGVGDRTKLATPDGDEELEITDIIYPEEE